MILEETSITGNRAMCFVYAPTGAASDFVIVDKGYDSQSFRKVSLKQGAIPVIPYWKNSRKPDQRIDKRLFRYRHLVENAFTRIKHFRAIVTRYDKLERNYASLIA